MELAVAVLVSSFLDSIQAAALFLLLLLMMLTPSAKLAISRAGLRWTAAQSYLLMSPSLE